MAAANVRARPVGTAAAVPSEAIAGLGLTQLAIDEQAPGAHGAPHGFDPPGMSHWPVGMPAPGSPTAGIPALAAARAASCAIAIECIAGTWFRCMLHNVPLVSRESWSRRAPARAAANRCSMDMTDSFNRYPRLLYRARTARHSRGSMADT